MSSAELQLIIDSYVELYKHQFELQRIAGYSAISAFAGKPLEFSWEKEKVVQIDKNQLLELIEERNKLINKEK